MPLPQNLRCLAPVAMLAAMLAAGCGADDRAAGAATVTKEDASARAPSDAIARAVTKTEDAGTARVEFDFDIGGDRPAHVSARGSVDFANRRDELTMTVQGRTIQLFNDRGHKYQRLGTSGRYRREPAGASTPVDNAPSDSLKYLGTDVVHVSRAAEDGCYDGSLDFTRVLRRSRGPLKPSQSQLRGKKAQVLICVDDAGRISRYDVEYALGGGAWKASSELSDHGDAPSLEPLGPDERP